MDKSIEELEYLIYRYHKIGKNIEKIKKFMAMGYHIIQCDASHNYKTREGSASVIITLPSEKEYKPKNYTFKSFGPVYAELKSLVYGLRVIQKTKHVEKSLILNDNYYALNFAVGNFIPQKQHIKDVVKELKNEYDKIPFEIQFGQVRSKVNRKADKLAKKELKRRDKEIEKRINKRIKSIEKNIKHAQKYTEYVIEDKIVKIKDPNSNFWFEVRFEPYPSCNCYWWKYNWGNKGEKIIRARALPCAHMCKAAEVLGLNIFDIFRKQIFRRD